MLSYMSVIPNLSLLDLYIMLIKVLFQISSHYQYIGCVYSRLIVSMYWYCFCYPELCYSFPNRYMDCGLLTCYFLLTHLVVCHLYVHYYADIWENVVPDAVCGTLIFMLLGCPYACHRYTMIFEQFCHG